VVCQKCHERIHGNIPVISDLNLEVRKYRMLRKLYVINQNWLHAYKRTFNLNPVELRLSRLKREKEKIMSNIRDMIKDDLKKVAHIKGFHPAYLAEILAFAHPNRFPSLRKFLVYCGYKESAKVTGRYNRKIHGLIRRLTDEVIMHKDEKYYDLYLKIKEQLARQYPNSSKAEIDGKTRNRVATFLLKEVYNIFKNDKQ
jgi:hypothetical protein